MRSAEARGRTSGFTLIEIVVVLAVLAVLAGAMVPAVVKQVERAKTDATRSELEALQKGLLAYYQDTKTLPTNANGLGALVTNVGAVTGWDGPYMGGRGDLTAQVTTDEWGAAYTYARAPSLAGGGSAAFIVLSPGEDAVLNSTLAGGTWTLDTTRDLCLYGDLTEIDAAWIATTRDQIDMLRDAITRYYLDVGAFPTGNDAVAIGGLVSSGATGWAGPYVTGTTAAASTDSWGATLRVRACTQVNGTAVTGRIVLSFGPGTPNATSVGSSWTTGANDIYVVLATSALTARRNALLVDRAKEELKTEAGGVYAGSPATSPPSSTLATFDPWGARYRYRRQTTYSGIAYSFGPNGVDNTGGNDDVYQALVWTP